MSCQVVVAALCVFPLLATGVAADEPPSTAPVAVESPVEEPTVVAVASVPVPTQPDPAASTTGPSAPSRDSETGSGSSLDPSPAPAPEIVVATIPDDVAANAPDPVPLLDTAATGGSSEGTPGVSERPASVATAPDLDSPPPPDLVVTIEPRSDTAHELEPVALAGGGGSRIASSVVFPRPEVTVARRAVDAPRAPTAVGSIGPDRATAAQPVARGGNTTPAAGQSAATFTAAAPSAHASADVTDRPSRHSSASRLDAPLSGSTGVDAVLALLTTQVAQLQSGAALEGLAPTLRRLTAQLALFERSGDPALLAALARALDRLRAQLALLDPALISMPASLADLAAQLSAQAPDVRLGSVPTRPWGLPAGPLAMLAPPTLPASPVRAPTAVTARSPHASAGLRAERNPVPVEGPPAPDLPPAPEAPVALSGSSALGHPAPPALFVGALIALFTVAGLELRGRLLQGALAAYRPPAILLAIERPD